MLMSAGVAFAAGAAEVDEVNLRLAHIYDPSHAWNKGAELAAELVEERTDGRITITVYPAGQQGTEPEILEQTILGSLDIAAAGAGQLGTIYSPINVMEMPYTFEDNWHVLEFGRSELANELFEGLREEHGIRVIGPSSYGIRQLTSNRRVETPEDLAGFQLRVPEQTVPVAYAEAMGANPTTIAYAEVYTALQQGAADGQENPLSAIHAMRFYEVQDYINLTSHVTNVCAFVMNDAVFQSLSEEDQAIVLEAFAEGSELIVEILSQEDEDLIGYFEEQGLTIVEPDIEAFREATAGMPEEYSYWWEDEFGADLHSRIQQTGN